MPHIETTEGTLYYTDYRQPKSPYTPVIWVHGAGGSRLDWSAQLKRLPQANALVVDLPGHGKSPPPGRGSVSDYAAVILAFMDALQIERAIIGGHSMGGAIAQTIALDYAGRVHGLILVGTGAKLRVHPDILERVQVAQDEVAGLLKDWIWGDSASDEMRQTAYTLLMATPAEVTYGDYLACDNFDMRERLSHIAAPTLVIGGTADRMTPHKYSVYLAENIQNAELVMVEGAGHMLALEQPDFVASAVAGWLERLKSEER